MIDLQRFCSNDGERTVKIDMPFSAGEHTYATNGHVAIRVARIADVAREDGPDIGRIFKDRPPVTNLQPLPTFDLPNRPNCDRCTGKGATIDCTDCSGAGTSVCDECGHESDCENCNADGAFPCDPRQDGANVCSECNGVGIMPINAQGWFLQIAPKLFINPGYLLWLKDLPNCKVDLGPNDGAGIWFTFDGGDGLLMPMRAPENYGATRVIVAHGVQSAEQEATA